MCRNFRRIVWSPDPHRDLALCFHDFILAPGAARTFNVPALDDGNFFYAQGQTLSVPSIGGDPQVLFGSWTYGHQSPVPEPSTIFLVAAAIASLFACESVQRFTRAMSLRRLSLTERRQRGVLCQAKVSSKPGVISTSKSDVADDERLINIVRYGRSIPVTIAFV